MIDRDFIRRMRAKYGGARASFPSSASLAGAAALDRFLADASVPLAVFHSRRLGRDFVLARDEKALEALTEADRLLPVLFFSDCEKLAGLGSSDLSKVLDVRQLFGPSASFTVEARLG
jgi:hypothetical protein